MTALVESPPVREGSDASEMACVVRFPLAGDWAPLAVREGRGDCRASGFEPDACARRGSFPR
jgi:hypothetical protein